MEQQTKEWQLLEKVALESFREQRRARRWGIFFKLLTFAYLLMAVVMIAGKSENLGSQAVKKTQEHTAVVRVHGPIMDDEMASANMIVGGMREAFKNEHSKAVLLAINSPGGSAVHAGYVYDEIKRLREKHPEKKVYAVISDLGASAAYYIAAAADEIYADKASLVGSIGVISASFGFTEAMDKIGIERRVVAAGDNKAFLDPYQPWKESEKTFWQGALQVVHNQFIEQVKNGRGDRLKDDAELFSGLIWPGEQALELGLVDGLGSAGFVAREVIGAEEIVDYSIRPHPLDEFARKLGLAASAGLFQQLKAEGFTPRLQ